MARNFPRGNTGGGNKMAYKVSVEYKKEYSKGRRIRSPKWKKEITCWGRKGIHRGAKGYEKHLEDVFGKENVRKFKIKKVKKC